MTKWIKWHGGECPIPDAKAGEYELKFHNEISMRKERAETNWYFRAKNLSWNQSLPLKGCDITHYKLIEAS